MANNLKIIIEPLIKNKTLGYVVSITLIIFLALNVVHFYLLNISSDHHIKYFWWIDCYNLINNILVGLVISYVIFVLVGYLPERKKIDLIKGNLTKQYIEFKKSIITIFLSAVNVQHDDALIKNLCKMENFRSYFKENENKNWYSVLNTISGNAEKIKEIVIELAIFRSELLFVLNNVSIDNDEIFSFLKRLSAVIYRLENCNIEYEDFKSLMGFFWDLFSGWSFVSGYRDDDLIQGIIDKI